MDPLSAWVVSRVVNAARRIGSKLFEPRSIRHKGMARADVRAYQKRLDAQVRQDIAAIERGEAKLGPDGRLALLPNPELTIATDPAQEVGNVTNSTDNAITDLHRAARTLGSLRGMKNLLNLRATVRMAEEEAERRQTDAGNAPPTDTSGTIDDDWLNHWRQGAEQVSDEHIQSIWARLLVGEAINPGSVNLRTLSILRLMSHREATKFAQLGPFIIGVHSIAKLDDNEYAAFGVLFPDLAELEDLGLISGTASITLATNWPIHDWNQKRAAFIPFCRNRLLVLTVSDPNMTEFQIAAIRLSPSGQQIMALGQFEANDDYIKVVAEKARLRGATGAQVQRGYWIGQQFHFQFVEELY